MRAVSDEDAQVEPQRRVLEVPEVELDPLGPRQRRAAVDLRPAGQARARRPAAGAGGRCTASTWTWIVGRGPTSDISPRRTLTRFGSSSIDVRRRNAPTRVIRVSPSSTAMPGAHVLGAGDHRAQLVDLERVARPCRRGAGGRSGGRGDSSRTASAASADDRRAERASSAPATREVERALAARVQVAGSPRALGRVPARRACRGAASRTGRRRARRWSARSSGRRARASRAAAGERGGDQRGLRGGGEPVDAAAAQQRERRERRSARAGTACRSAAAGG